MPCHISKKTYLQFKLDAIRNLLSDADLDDGLQNGTDHLNGRNFPKQKRRKNHRRDALYATTKMYELKHINANSV